MLRAAFGLELSCWHLRRLPIEACLSTPSTHIVSHLEVDLGFVQVIAMRSFVAFFELIFHLLFFEVSKHLEFFRDTVTLTSACIIEFRLGGMLDPVWPYLFLCDARSASD